MNGIIVRLVAFVLCAAPLGACSFVLDPSEHSSGSTTHDGGGGSGGATGGSGGQGGSGGSGGSGNNGGSGGNSGGNGGSGGSADLDGGAIDGGEDASDPFQPPEGCDDPDLDEECMAIDCGPLTEPLHGTVVTAGGTTFGQVADYSCAESYGVVGVSRRTCQANGEWSDEAPICELGDCPTLLSPDNGVVTTPQGTKINSTATYSCNPGYSLVGEADRVCQPSKTWTGTAAACEIRDCGAATAPNNGTVETPDGTTYGDSASYSCALGYALDGNATGTCTAEGTWSAPPTCPYADECTAGTHTCGAGSCVSGAGYGYGCACNNGYASTVEDFPSCEAVPVLGSATTELLFGDRENGTTSSSMSWVIDNDGSVASGAIEVDVGSSDFEVTNGCSAGAAAGASCTISVRFSPDSYGPRSATITASSATSNELELDVSGNSQARLTVAASGTGTVTGERGISCPGTCSALFDYGDNVELRANTSNGSGAYFSGWSSSDCDGPARECAVGVNGSMTVTATFSPMTHNLVFVTSGTYAANLGGASAYDSRCNQVATAAGINNSGGTGFIAAVSDENSVFTSRLGGSVRGWVRLDGKPFGTTATAISTGGSILHPVAFDEEGNHLEAVTFSGFNENGWPFQTCNNYTSSSSSVYGRNGSSIKGPKQWLMDMSSECSYARAITCIGNTQTAALTPPVVSGKRIWLSDNYRGGAVTPDARCHADRPAGVASGIALVGFTNIAPASRLSLSTNYVRPDGQLVGTGQQLVDMELNTGIWQLGDGSYNQEQWPQNWCGSESLTEVGTAEYTCNNWTNATSAYSGLVGDSDTTGLRYWWTFGSVECDAFGDPDRVLRLYCIEP